MSKHVRSSHPWPKQMSLCTPESQQKLFCLAELTVMAGSSQSPPQILKRVKENSQKGDRREMLMRDPLTAHYNLYSDKHPARHVVQDNAACVPEDDNLECCDTSTASPQTSLGSIGRSEEEGLYLLAKGKEVRRERSLTIHFYDRKRRAGDPVRCRVWNNESNRFRDYQNKEILEFVGNVIQIGPYYCFYVKTDGSGPVSRFHSDLIYRALSLTLERARDHDRIVIPNKTVLSYSHKRENKEKRDYSTSHRPVGGARLSVGNR